uniref:Uncharacterized protein n=1 Tax=Anguilla anguilla TaxID=7936 RepID=A0A0E9PTU3_ANGAN
MSILISYILLFGFKFNTFVVYTALSQSNLGNLWDASTPVVCNLLVILLLKQLT